MVEITNANDVEFIVDGASTNAARMVVDDFSLSREVDAELLSGVGNHLPQGYSVGNITHSFSFTIQGMYSSVWNSLAEGDGMFTVLGSVMARGDGFNVKMMELIVTDDELSASDGDPMEVSVEGIAVSVSR